jgi:hypothetical protein
MPEIKDEFDDIVAQLLEERPTIDPSFARDLDAKAAAGFPRRRRLAFLPTVKWHFPMWVPAGGLAAAVAVIVAVGAISGTGGGSDDASSGSTAQVATVSEDDQAATGAAGGTTEFSEPLAKEAAPSEARRDSAGAAAGDVLESQSSASTIAPSAPPPLGRERLQELSAAVTVEVPSKEIQAANDQIMVITNQVGGFVVSSNVRSTDGDTGGGSYVLRIPVENLQDGLTRLGRLGHVRERTQGVQDITSERNVARENLQETKAVRISLLKRIAEADTDAEIAALRAQLRSVNAQIGAFRGQLRQVERRASFAQVSLTLTAADKDAAGADEDSDDEWTPGDAFDDAGRVLEVVAAVGVIALAVLIPLLMLVAAGVATRRMLARRGRERALDAI